MPDGVRPQGVAGPHGNALSMGLLQADIVFEDLQTGDRYVWLTEVQFRNGQID